ncbi:MAG: ABC transporter substrate-binding protein [Actinobacteria bacterium]|nr:ABC transporter substrate-binding protein [Actinomycetota bacterium]
MTVDATRPRLKVAYAGVLYDDRVGALFRGDVDVPDVDLTCIAFRDVADLFRRVATFAEFPVAEMSLATTARMIGNGDSRFTAVPVFPSRAFRHSQIYIRLDRGIENPQDLAGKRIGVIEYEMTAALWIRGMLSDDFGVDAQSIDWYTGGWEQPAKKSRVGHDVEGIPLTRITDTSLVAMLADGALDAVIGPKAPSAFHERPDVVGRLFPGYRAVEEDYYRRTRMFPIMHHIVIRREIDEEHPWLATTLADAFARSKEVGRRFLLDFDKPAVMHPWIVDDIERLGEVFGEQDPFAYGVEPNRHVLDTALRYCHEQGLTPKQLSMEDVYARTVLDWHES